MKTISERLLRERYTSHAACSALLLLALGSTHCGDEAVILLEQPAPEPLQPAPGEAPEPGDPALPGEDPTAPEGNGSEPGGGEGNPGDPPLDGKPTDGNGTPGEPVSDGPCQPRASGGPFWLTEQESVQIGL